MLSVDEVGGPVTDHGVALRVEDVLWVGRQLWSNDAAEKGGTYCLYFPTLAERRMREHLGGVRDAVARWGPGHRSVG